MKRESQGGASPDDNASHIVAFNKWACSVTKSL